MTRLTWIISVMWRMNASRQATHASASPNANDTDTRGTNPGSVSVWSRTERSTVSENTNVPMNTPNVACTTRLLRKLPSTRGVNWLLASCRTTIVIENTTPELEIIAEAIVVRTSRAASGPPGNTQRTYGRSQRSASGNATPSTSATSAEAAGTAQNGAHTRAHQVRRLTSGGIPGSGSRRPCPDHDTPGGRHGLGARPTPVRAGLPRRVPR